MSPCVNENCRKDPLNSLKAVIVNIDGDMACCPECRDEYEKQKQYFFDHIVHDEAKCEKWLKGEI